MPQTKKGKPTGDTAHGVRYPWADWFRSGRGIVTLAQGRDYRGATHGMISTIYQACRRYGVKVTLWSTDDGRISFRRIPNAESRRGRKRKTAIRV